MNSSLVSQRTCYSVHTVIQLQPMKTMMLCVWKIEILAGFTRTLSTYTELQSGINYTVITLSNYLVAADIRDFLSAEYRLSFLSFRELKANM